MKQLIRYETWDDPYDSPVTKCPFRMRDKDGFIIYVGTENCHRCKYWVRTSLYPRFVICTRKHIPLSEILSYWREKVRNLLNKKKTMNQDELVDKIHAEWGYLLSKDEIREIMGITSPEEDWFAMREKGMKSNKKKI